MRKSARVTVTIAAAVALAGCGRRRVDPCEAATFNEQACQDAVAGGGYYWGGTWYPMQYHSPYPYYYDRYHSYVSSGGRVSAAPAGSYGSRSGSSVVRGGFGASGAAHGAGSGGE